MRSPLRLLASATLVAAFSIALTPQAGADGGANAGRTTLRCGWFDNPTPGNASLFDRDGEWTIAIQGDFQASGDWPEFKASQWVRRGQGSAGHGCACLQVVTDDDEHNILRIVSSRVRPLSACRQDKALREPE
jgi:hypothetical protein